MNIDKKHTRLWKVIQIIAVIGVMLAMCISTLQLALAADETIAGSDSFTTELKTASSIDDITINGTGNDTIPVKLLVSNGTLAMGMTTGLTFKDASGNTISNPQTGSTLYFSGTRTDVNAALATLTYTRNTTGTDTLEVSLVPPGEVFFSENNHLYEYVPSTLTWGNAKTAAEARSKYGATGYLATITSQEENDFVASRLTNAGWMGASDVDSESIWKWVTGPENGTTFSTGNAPSMTPAPGQYENWNTGEPNDSGSNEDCGQFLSGGTGKWNDLPCSGTTLPGYVVEYGETGDLPTVTAKNISITTSDTVAPTTPGTPTTTTPNTDQTPSWSWSASTDSGVGLANPAYTVQWSRDSNFASGVNSTTTNSISYTHVSNLADGTWYFRVQASDLSGNNSSYSAVANVTIDTTGPSAPGIDTTSVTTNDNTPTVDWSASTDSGVGLANPAYTVQWSQDSNFVSGVSSTTTTDASHTLSTLADGTWYMRIRATDQLDNNSAWSSTITILIDTVEPSTPGTPTTTKSVSRDNTPTFNWTASTDTGSGLAYTAYEVQWSRDTAFSSLGGTDGVVGGATSYTIPNGMNMSDGIWYFQVRSIDAAGNYSAWSGYATVTIDTTPALATNVTTTDNSSATRATTLVTQEFNPVYASSGAVTTSPEKTPDSKNVITPPPDEINDQSDTQKIVGNTTASQSNTQLYYWQVIGIFVFTAFAWWLLAARRKNKQNP